jgi:hypothetical protein
MGLFALVELPTLVVLGSLGLIVGFFLWRSQRCLAGQPKGGPPLVRTTPAPSGREVQMHKTTHDLPGQFDGKMGTLEKLVREADRVATRLETALEAARPLDERLPARETPTGLPSQPLAEPDPIPSQPTNQAEALKAVGGGTQGAAPHGVRWEEEAIRRAPAEQRYEEIYRLNDYGFDTTEIARRVGSPEGEVELILGLRRKR